MKVNVAIDGPSASGKSTIAKALAKKLNYTHIDTGSMYRACAYKALKDNIEIHKTDDLIESIKHSTFSFNEHGEICLDGVNINDKIRSKQIDLLTSQIASIEQVRKVLVALQQDMVKSKGFVMDGRDIGSVVMPDAEVKIFQTASIESRVTRRYNQYISAGSDVTYQQIYDEISQRDYNDSHRIASPLVKMPDAFELNTSELSIEDSVNIAYAMVSKKIQEFSHD